MDKNKNLSLLTHLEQKIGEEKMEDNSEENEMHLTKDAESKFFSRKYSKRQRFNEYASLVSCILNDSESLKSAGHDDIDCYMRKSDLSKESYDMALVKHGLRRENSVENDVHYEKQDLGTELVSSEPTSYTSAKCDSSASDSEDFQSDEALQTSDVADGENSKLRTDNFNTFTEANIEYEGYDINYEEYLKSFGEDFDISKEFFNSSHIDQHVEDEIGLIDAQLTANASYRAENVPFVCLTSKWDGKAVLGYPVEIEELTDSSETSISESLDEEGRRFARLVWRTSRRTPICYGKNFVYAVPSQFKKGRTQSNACCVPVQRIFSKILAGVGEV